jgi:hypothetical protein
MRHHVSRNHTPYHVRGIASLKRAEAGIVVGNTEKREDHPIHTAAQSQPRSLSGIPDSFTGGLFFPKYRLGNYRFSASPAAMGELAG